jgi:putative membrane protein
MEKSTMTLRWLLAFVHLLALPMGLSAVGARSRALKGVVRGESLKAAFVADTWWGIAAFVWISTGLARYLGGTEKPTEYYNNNWVFIAKMGMLALILILEIWPMITLIRWRINAKKQIPVDTSPARTLAAISDVQALLVFLMIAAAVAMARGIGITQ